MPVAFFLVVQSVRYSSAQRALGGGVLVDPNEEQVEEIYIC